MAERKVAEVAVGVIVPTFSSPQPRLESLFADYLRAGLERIIM